MFGVATINVYPIPDFDYKKREPCLVWRVDVRQKGGGLSTEFREAVPVSYNSDNPVLVRFGSAEEAEMMGRHLAASMNMKRVRVRKFSSYEKFLNRWVK